MDIRAQTIGSVASIVRDVSRSILVHSHVSFHRTFSSILLVPRHSGQDHSHPAGIGDSGEDQTGFDECRQPDKCRMDQPAKHRSQQHEQSDDFDSVGNSADADDFLSHRLSQLLLMVIGHSPP